MKKNMLFLGLAQLFCGLLFCAAATFGNFPYNAFLWGLTGAGLGSSIVTLFSYWYNQNPERAQLYEKRLETHRILLQDERHIMLRDRACYISFCALLLAEGLCVVIFSLLATFGIFMEFSRTVVVLLSLLILLHLLFNLIVFHWLSRRL
ncbi:MAG TPA: hypothetical protein IAA65_05715 [Candidatus Galloscillospira excrementipullorum]|nr:hypothetical protein [Candidatus Galloscillospira excrementipullorum]